MGALETLSLITTKFPCEHYTAANFTLNNHQNVLREKSAVGLQNIHASVTMALAERSIYS